MSFATTLAELLGCQVSDVCLDDRGGFSMRAGSITYPPYRNKDYDTDTESDDEVQHEHSYRTLKADEIRLLVLNPGTRHEPIHCYLDHHVLQKTPSYQALSYVWNPDNRNGGVEEIYLDGGAFPVTKSLKQFLLSFRSEYDASLLWVDAVCINQYDLLSEVLRYG